MLSKVLVTINDGKIEEVSNDLVEMRKEVILNTTKWEFLSTDLFALNNIVNEFLNANKKYIISYSNMPLEKLVVNLLHKKKLTISFCESCTGGMLASTLVNVSGSSNVFNESFVTYSNEAKIKHLGVNKGTIEKYSVYSPEVAEEMALGLYNKTLANVCVSITGRAGGDEFTEGDGTYDFAIVINIDDYNYIHVEHSSLTGSRNEVRKMQTTYIFYRIYQLLERI